MTARPILPALVLGLAYAGAAHGATIVGLYNTGLNSGGTVLGADGQADAHWTVVSSTSGDFAGQAAVTYTNILYASNGGDSRWVSLDGTGGFPNGTTTYRLSFDLTGFDLDSVAITGTWGVDDGGVIALNGVDTTNVLTPSGFTTFNPLHPFALTGGFVQGINTLDVRVINQGGVTAFRIANLSGSGDLNPVSSAPEPAAWALMILGFGAAGAALRRRGAATRRA